MRALAGPAAAALSARELSVAQLVYMEFPGFPIALCSANSDIVFAGVTYRGAAGLGTIAPINDAPGEIKGIQLELSGVPTEYLALALDDADIVQGTVIAIRLAIMNIAGLVLDAPLDWAGRLDTMSIQEDGETCSISVTAESVAVDLLRGNALTTSDADQRSLHPGDRAFEYVISQANIPIVWPTKQLFIAMR
jgi:hypothetical protein